MTIQGMDDGVKVEEGGANNFHLVGVEGHPEGNPVVAEEAGGGGSQSDAGDEPTVLHVTDWMCKRLGSSVAAKAATFPWTREMPPPPPDSCFVKSPHPCQWQLPATCPPAVRNFPLWAWLGNRSLGRGVVRLDPGPITHVTRVPLGPPHPPGATGSGLGPWCATASKGSVATTTEGCRW